MVYLRPDYMIEWENLASYSVHPLAGKYKAGLCCYKSVMHRDSPCPGCVMQRALETGKREMKEVTFEDGLSVEITATPVYDIKGNGNIRGVVLKYEDISERIRVANEWKRAKEAAEMSDKLKSMFLSNMSHEIRTPLNAIVGFSELLVTTDDPKDREEYMTIINRNNELLLQLISDILDLSKIEAGTLEFIYDTVDINEMLRGLEISYHQKMIEFPEVEIAFTSQVENCVIYTEKNRVMQVISNFLIMRSSSRRKDISISVTRCKREDCAFSFPIRGRVSPRKSNPRYSSVSSSWIVLPTVRDWVGDLSDNRS